MHDPIFYAVILWQLVLVAVLAGYTVRASNVANRTLALETLAIVFVAALATLAIHRCQAGYLDIALVLAMLGFVQTVATVRLVERREWLR